MAVIILHELGHLFSAKRCKCKVNEFSVGFGKTIIQRKINGTNYKLCWILLGGYCALDGELEYTKKKYALTNLRYLQKLYIVFAGVAVNCLSGIFAFGFYSMFGIEYFQWFGHFSILLGLSNLIILFPGIDGAYALLFLLEKPFGKKDGIALMNRAVEVGMFFLNVLNIVCIIYFGQVFIKWIWSLIR
jgi:membrane-associated protease RseP (regulator of RpoE activity)